MARRKKAKRRTYRRKYTPRRKRKTGGGSLPFGIGKLGTSPVMKGILGGAVVGITSKLIPIPIAGADAFIAGFLLKDNWLLHYGGYQLGRTLAGGIAGGFGATGNQNSLFGGD